MGYVRPYSSAFASWRSQATAVDGSTAYADYMGSTATATSSSKAHAVLSSRATATDGSSATATDTSDAVATNDSSAVATWVFTASASDGSTAQAHLLSSATATEGSTATATGYSLGAAGNRACASGNDGETVVASATARDSVGCCSGSTRRSLPPKRREPQAAGPTGTPASAGWDVVLEQDDRSDDGAVARRHQACSLSTFGAAVVTLR